MKLSEKIAASTALRPHELPSLPLNQWAKQAEALEAKVELFRSELSQCKMTLTDIQVELSKLKLHLVTLDI